MDEKNNRIEGEVEIEDNENTVITEPFDPNSIKVSTHPHTLGDIIDRLEHGEIMLDTEFQRRPDLWNNTKKSRFIESLLLRLPIPTFYFDGADDDKWRVIDGLQRISTLKSFVMDKTLILENLEFLKDFEGNKFDELPRELQRRIRTFAITISVLEKGTPDLVKYNIFSRINQGGLVLKPQEIRHALHQGQGSNLIKSLADKNTPEAEAFIKATEGKIKSERMEDRDFITRFIAFYLISYKEYEPDLDAFMNKGMGEIKKLNSRQVEKLKQDFRNAMQTAWEIFGNDAFRKRFRQEDTRYPINKALFEVLSVNFAKLSDEERDTLIQRREKFKERFRALLNNSDEKFKRAITYGTAQKEKVEQRFKDIGTIIKETLNDNKC